MKRGKGAKSVAALAVCTALGLAGCEQAVEQIVPSGSGDAGWLVPPTIDSVEWLGSGVSVSGTTVPQGRVVFSADGGRSYAVAAGADGRYTVVLDVAAPGALLLPRLYSDQGAATAAGVLFVTADENPVAAVLVPGEGTVRLGVSGTLEAVDGDGETLIISGQAESEVRSTINVDGRVIPVEADADGRWAVVVPSGDGPGNILVADRMFAYPGTYAAGREALIAYVGDGWLVRRKFADGAVQTTWLPTYK